MTSSKGSFKVSSKSIRHIGNSEIEIDINLPSILTNGEYTAKSVYLKDEIGEYIILSDWRNSGYFENTQIPVFRTQVAQGENLWANIPTLQQIKVSEPRWHRGQPYFFELDILNTRNIKFGPRENPRMILKHESASGSWTTISPKSVGTVSGKLRFEVNLSHDYVLGNYYIQEISYKDIGGEEYKYYGQSNSDFLQGTNIPAPKLLIER